MSKQQRNQSKDRTHVMYKQQINQRKDCLSNKNTTKTGCVSKQQGKKSKGSLSWLCSKQQRKGQ